MAVLLRCWKNLRSCCGVDGRCSGQPASKSSESLPSPEGRSNPFDEEHAAVSANVPSQPWRSTVSLGTRGNVPGRIQVILRRRLKHTQSLRGVDDGCSGQPAARSSLSLLSPDRLSDFCDQEHASSPVTVPLQPWLPTVTKGLWNVPKKIQGVLSQRSENTRSRRGVDVGSKGEPGRKVISVASVSRWTKHLL
ncbi:hypothetical protein MRX96_058347 [Rhipicephalus microplus]